MRLRHSSSRWLAFAVLLCVSTAAESNADDDQRPGRRRNRGRRPPQPDDLSLVDDGKQLLVAGVDIKTPQENIANDIIGYIDEDEKQVPTAVRGMLYHYEPILPPYDGRYFDEVEEAAAAAAAALPPSVPAVEPIEEDETEPVASTSSDALSVDANEGSATSAADNADKSTKEADEDTVAAEEEEGIGTESEELSTLADAIVDAAMTLDDEAIGKVADKLEEDGTQSQQGPMEQAASDENADDNDDADAERVVTDEVMMNDDNDADDNDGRKSVSEDNTTVDTIDVEISAAMDEEEDIVVEEESSASTAKVESPKADGNSVVVAEKAAKVDSEMVGVGSTPVNASYTASETDGLVQPDKEGTETPATDAENDDVEANDGGAEEQAAQPTSDLKEQPTENIGIDADSDKPSEMLGDGTTDSRRIAEEKGVPTNTDSAASVAGGANTTLGDSDVGDTDAGPSDIAGDDSVEGIDAHTVPNNDEQIDGSEIRPDSQRYHESWTGIYDRELGDNEGETGAKRLDVESLDNVREYSGSDGFVLTGSTISREDDTATIDNATAANEAKDDAFEKSLDDEKKDEDTAAGSTDNASTNTELPAFDSLSDVNSDFIDGIDDLDKFLEEVDTPDELDVAHGSSMQEVLVGKGVQILVKKVTAVVRRVKSIVSIVGTRVGNSKIAGKIREGMETSGIIALGEKVREASSISEHKEKVAGFGKTVGRAVDDKWDAMNAWIDELMDNDFVDTAKNIFGRIKASSVVTRIVRALGLSEDDDDDLMDFSSFKRSGNDASSLEDRLAAMRKQAMY